MNNELKLQRYIKKTINSCKNCKSNGSPSQIDCQNNCWEKSRKAIKFINANIPVDYFDLGIESYSNANIENLEDIEVREKTLKKINIYCKRIDEMIDKGWGVVLMGPYGTGKSLLANHILKTALEKEYSAYSREFSEMINMSITGKDYAGIEKPIYEELSKIDFYCIENVGWEYSKEQSTYVPLKLDSFITLRHQHGLPTIITMNMTASDLKKDYGDHIYSVLKGHCLFLHVPGVDNRNSINKYIRKALEKDEEIF
jgi:DNA replication protein DnaC